MEAPPLNVFLDTSVFVEANFDYRSQRFRSIASLGKSAVIRVFLTDVTIREIEDKIREKVKEALPVKPKPILRNSDLPEITKLHDTIDPSTVENELLDQFRGFLNDANVTIIRVDGASIWDVFNKYFKREPPFGPGKNKAEFPDAFALDALEKWCTTENDDVAVVTRDRAIAEACEDSDWFYHFEDLAKYLDLVVSNDDARSEFVRHNVLPHKTRILELAKDKFYDVTFTLNEVDGDVEEVELIDIDFDGEDIAIISFSDVGAIVEVSLEVSFTASMTYDVPGTGIYDKEDNRLYFQESVTEDVERTTDARVEIAITVQGLDPESVRVVDVKFRSGEIVDVDTKFYEDWRVF